MCTYATPCVASDKECFRKVDASLITSLLTQVWYLLYKPTAVEYRLADGLVSCSCCLSFGRRTPPRIGGILFDKPTAVFLLSTASTSYIFRLRPSAGHLSHRSLDPSTWPDLISFPFTFLHLPYVRHVSSPSPFYTPTSPFPFSTKDKIQEDFKTFSPSSRPCLWFFFLP